MYKQFRKYQEDEGGDFSIDPFTLSFKNRPLEKRFRTAYFENNLQLGRACHLIAVFFYLMVGLWDGLYFDPEHFTAWKWVLFAVSLVFSAGLLSSFTAPEIYARHWQLLFAGYVLVTGFGFTVITICSGPEYPIHNFIGIIFCLIFCYAFIRLTFLYALAAGNIIVAVYSMGAFFYFDVPAKLLLNEFFYMFGINLLGMMVCYAMELLSRRDYMLNTMLRQAQRKTRDMNTRLEQMVGDRTYDLHLSNRELENALVRETQLVARLEKEEKRLQKSLASLEQAERIARLGYFEKDWNKDDIFWSKGFPALLGENPDVTRVTDETFLSFIHGDDREVVLRNLKQSVKERRSMDMEFRMTAKNGDCLDVYGVADHSFDKDGSLLVSEGIVQDITAQKKAGQEVEKLTSQLVQAQKMESIGRLAGGVAHDYNNISGIIMGYAELAMEEIGPDNPLYGKFERILTAAKRATEITRQLLAFARKQTISPQVIDLNQTVERMSTILERLIGEDIDLSWKPGREIWPVKIDPVQVDQILANLCVNARDAICDTGKITIETRNISFDPSYCDVHPGFSPGAFSMLAVSDDGSGMAPEILERVFEPFFTTKELGRGTGLGLATVYGIVKQNKGFINVYSEPGEGTSIKVYLARHMGAPDVLENQGEKDLEAARGAGETVLIVEDDEAILDLAGAILTRFGYRLLLARTPEQALAFLNKEADNIRLLLTDIVMPEMNGRQLAKIFSNSIPGIQTIFMSGYTANIIAHRGVLDKRVNFIAKPFSGRALAAKVRKILDNRG